MSIDRDEKLRAINEYLAEGNVEPRWREMIGEYHRLLLDRGELQDKLVAEIEEHRATKKALQAAVGVIFSCEGVLDKNMPEGIAERVGATGVVYQLLKEYRRDHHA